MKHLLFVSVILLTALPNNVFSWWVWNNGVVVQHTANTDNVINNDLEKELNNLDPNAKKTVVAVSSSSSSHSSSSSSSSNRNSLPGPCDDGKSNYKCVVCDEAVSEEECMKNGHNTQCQRGQNACVLETANIDNKILYYRRCGHLCECGSPPVSIKKCAQAGCVDLSAHTDSHQSVNVSSSG